MIGWSSFQPAGQEQTYLLDALASGWVSGGPYVAKLEEQVQAHFGGRALAVSNGTAALFLAYQTLGLRSGDRVLVPGFCFQAAANALMQLGAVPVFYDVDPLTWNATAATVKTALQAYHDPDHPICGIVVVHNYGYGGDIAAIADLAKAQGIWLIEDAAEAWFSAQDGAYLGTFGDVSTFSMHATKTIACGEGGIVLINRPDLVGTAELYRSHGLNREAIQYMHLLPGNNYRLSNLLAAVACAQLEARESILAQQAARTQAFRAALADMPECRFQASIVGADDRAWADAVFLDTTQLAVDRDRLMQIIKERGVDLRPGFYTPKSLTYYSNPEATPVSDRIAAQTIVLPCALSMTPEDWETVTSVVREVITQARVPELAAVLHQVTADAPGALLALIPALNSHSDGFRYFESRDVSVLQDHLTTVVLMINDQPVGYGHLDQEGPVTWLGIAILPSYSGKGFGHKIMQALMQSAADQGLEQVDLFVDRTNDGAQHLYLRHGFHEQSEQSNSAAVRMICRPAAVQSLTISPLS